MRESQSAFPKDDRLARQVFKNSRRLGLRLLQTSKRGPCSPGVAPQKDRIKRGATASRVGFLEERPQKHSKSVQTCEPNNTKLSCLMFFQVLRALQFLRHFDLRCTFFWSKSAKTASHFAKSCPCDDVGREGASGHGECHGRR